MRFWHASAEVDRRMVPRKVSRGLANPVRSQYPLQSVTVQRGAKSEPIRHVQWCGSGFDGMMGVVPQIAAGFAGSAWV
jgi:hypothetical protein